MKAAKKNSICCRGGKHVFQEIPAIGTLVLCSLRYGVSKQHPAGQPVYRQWCQCKDAWRFSVREVEWRTGFDFKVLGYREVLTVKLKKSVVARMEAMDNAMQELLELPGISFAR